MLASLSLLSSIQFSGEFGNLGCFCYCLTVNTDFYSGMSFIF